MKSGKVSRLEKSRAPISSELGRSIVIKEQVTGSQVGSETRSMVFFFADK